LVQTDLYMLSVLLYWRAWPAYQTIIRKYSSKFFIQDAVLAQVCAPVSPYKLYECGQRASKIAID